MLGKHSPCAVHIDQGTFTAASPPIFRCFWVIVLKACFQHHFLLFFWQFLS